VTLNWEGRLKLRLVGTCAADGSSLQQDFALQVCYHLIVGVNFVRTRSRARYNQARFCMHAHHSSKPPHADVHKSAHECAHLRAESFQRKLSGLPSPSSYPARSTRPDPARSDTRADRCSGSNLRPTSPPARSGALPGPPPSARTRVLSSGPCTFDTARSTRALSSGPCTSVRQRATELAALSCVRSERVV
jgi:hypothetical protein